MSVKQSYSQSGEDLVVDFIFDTLQIKTRRFLDIGANEPVALSNTYLFYKQGHSGVCIEPDPDLVKKFKQERPNDKVIEAGIGAVKGKKDFYLMEPNTLNTFSKDEAEAYQKYYPWASVRKIVKVKLMNINDIINKHFKNGVDLLSVDTEGLDEEIIRGIDFTRHKPLIICVETAVYSGEKSLTKNVQLISYLQDMGYFVYADTFVNTIFVEYDEWQKHKGAKLENF